MNQHRTKVVTVQDLVRAGAALEARGELSTQLTGVKHDSRRVEPGDLFVAIAGAHHDGTRFVQQAIHQGARAVLAEHWVSEAVPGLRAANARAALAHASRLVYGDPTGRLPVIGVTGTNGKTSVTEIIRWTLTQLGARVATLGTLGAKFEDGSEDAALTDHTTPEADDIMRFASAAAARNCTHLAMEVSSHALALHRADGVHFQVAAFTNLTQDHLDFHTTMEAYGEAKARLFLELTPASCVICVDDAFGERLAERAASAGRNVLRVSSSAAAHADVQLLSSEQDVRGLRLRVRLPGAPDTPLHTALIGAHNVQNLLVALACLVALGADVPSALARLHTFPGVAGRMERVSAQDSDVHVFVDYAHTPDALGKALAAIRPFAPGRLIVVFGAGGNRDAGKRPKMGRAAADVADCLVLTSDNPRDESPEGILEAIEQGVRGRLAGPGEIAELGVANKGYWTVADRRQAIELAIRSARRGDVIVIAGKGHETYQIVRGVRFAFDDRIESRRALAARSVA